MERRSTGLSFIRMASLRSKLSVMASATQLSIGSELPEKIGGTGIVME